MSRFPRESRITGVARDPHVSLALGAAAVLLIEAARGSATLATSPIWPVLQAVVAAASLLAAFVQRDRLRLGALLGLAAGFQLGWIAVHVGLGVQGDYDAALLYPQEGHVLLQGGYPRSEYPPGAVGLFALEAWLGGNNASVANALLLVPFQLLGVVALWSLRTRWSGVFAAFVALWPLDAFYWEFRFDLLPTAALVTGLLLAERRRWTLAGLALGCGTLAKWTPAVAALVLAIWLLRSRCVRDALRHTLAFAEPLATVYIPLLAWRPSEVLASYSFQGSRIVTAESLPYLPLRLWGGAHPGYWYFGAADVSAGQNRLALLAQLGVMATLLALVLWIRRREAAVALAALAPAVFLLTNRVFSPQYFVTIVAAFAVAAILTNHGASEVLMFFFACAVATTANTVLFQCYLGARPAASLPGWTFISAATFAPAVAIALWLVVRTAYIGRAHPIPVS